MGDRSNVFIQQVRVGEEWQGVGFYSHWGGRDMQVTAIECARDAVGRVGDPSYFARRVLQNLLNAACDASSDTGGGLWSVRPDDNEYLILVINGESGLAWLAGEGDYRADAPNTAEPIGSFELPGMA